MVNAVHARSQAESAGQRQESADYCLNRAYRALSGLLTPDGRTALVKKERAWLTKRDAIKSKDEQDGFVEMRTEELKHRSEKAFEQKEEE